MSREAMLHFFLHQKTMMRNDCRGRLLSCQGGEEKTAGEEERVAEMCSLIEGVGECRVMMTYGGEGEVYAVLVLCEGAESARVRGDLTSLICSLYGIGSHRVEIFLLNE